MPVAGTALLQLRAAKPSRKLKTLLFVDVAPRSSSCRDLQETGKPGRPRLGGWLGRSQCNTMKGETESRLCSRGSERHLEAPRLHGEFVRFSAWAFGRFRRSRRRPRHHYRRQARVIAYSTTL